MQMPDSPRTSRALPETNSATKASTPALSIRALVVLAIVASGVYAVDQVTKYFVVANLTERVRVPFIGELLQFQFVKNSGAAFSLGEGMTWIFSIRSTGWAVLFGMLLGGNLGNLTDRLFREPSFGQGHVIDFLQLYAFPAIFNIADVAIVASMGLFIILTLRGIGLDGQRIPNEKNPSADTATDPAATDLPK
jgi:signal peptidase II